MVEIILTPIASHYSQIVSNIHLQWFDLIDPIDSWLYNTLTLLLPLVCCN